MRRNSLVLAVAAVLALILLSGQPVRAAGPAVIDTPAFAALVDQALAGQDVGLLIDVRTPAEFFAGHIPGTDHLPLDLLPRVEEAIKDKSTRITVFCRTQNRSIKFAKGLLAKGYTNVTVYGGGIVGWIQAGHELANFFMGRFKVTEYNGRFEGPKLDPYRLRVRMGE